MANILISLLLVAMSAVAESAPLETYQAFVAGGDPADARRVGNTSMLVRGTGTRNFYYLEVDPTTGRLPVDATVSFADPDVNYVTSVNNDYSVTPVTTAAWVQLVASTSAKITRFSVFDSCGEVLELGTGAAASESRKYLIPPGGIDSPLSLTIASGTRISIRAVTANCTTGRLVITFLGTA